MSQPLRTPGKKTPGKRAPGRPLLGSANPIPLTPGSSVSSPLPFAHSSVFSSPARARAGNSEVDVSSPLHYGTPGSRGTPIRARADIRSGRKLRQFNRGEETENAVSERSSAAGGAQLVIWGTDVSVQLCKDKFRVFLRRFETSHYQDALEAIRLLEQPFLDLDCEDVRSFDPDLHRQLLCYPQEVIPALDMAANELFFEQYAEAELPHQIQVRPFNVQPPISLRQLNPENVDQLVTISGLVVRSSPLVPEMREAFSDKQMVKLQEAPEATPAGQTPQTVLLSAHNDLVDAVNPGDRVQVTGIFRAAPFRVNPRQRNVHAVYRTYIDVVQYRKEDSHRLHEDDERRLAPDRVLELQTIASQSDVYERLANAIAPSIYENVDIKKGLLLQLFGGTRKEKTKCRSEINILLCGDPGTSKSQLLQFVYRLVPRGQYTSGRGSSAVGLTAFVTKDPETRQLVLQTGALVLSDNGVCCIDEFDKMSDVTRSVLHEVMEQQTLSVAKAGIICQLNARTSILAAANPVESAWNAQRTIIENIQLPATLLSRFDLIFLILDPQHEAFDRRLATHLVSLYYTREEHADIDLPLLRDYILYARQRVRPRLSDPAAQALVHAYVEMRRAAGRGQISAFPRQLESLIRLSEGHAKMRLSSSVECVDVEEARRLHREALKQAAIDPATGRIDIGILTTGMSSAARKKRHELATALRALIQAKGRVAVLQYQHVFQEMREQAQTALGKELFDEALRELQEDDFLVVTGKSIRPIFA